MKYYVLDDQGNRKEIEQASAKTENVKMIVVYRAAVLLLLIANIIAEVMNGS